MYFDNSHAVEHKIRSAMDNINLEPLLQWIQAHPAWSGLVVFLTALAESLALVGIVFPGAMMMFGFGALVAAGAMALWPTLAYAIVGAIAGDGLSYWLGRHYQEQLSGLWPFSRYPDLLEKGKAFFKRHGGKSIIFGRFVGPVRPVIPVVAGMLLMPASRFIAVNVISALAWGPAYLLPGVIFGASLGLAAEVASRLVIVIALFVGVLWLIFTLVHRLIRLLPLRTDLAIGLTLLFLGGGGGYWVAHPLTAHDFGQHPLIIQEIPQNAWWEQRWQELPALRIDRSGRARQALTLQWAGSLEGLRQRLTEMGWRDPLPLTAGNLLRLLAPTPTELPILPQLHEGQREVLRLVHPQEGGDLLVVRLWDSGVKLTEEGFSQTPLWIGYSGCLRPKHPIPWITLLRGETCSEAEEVLRQVFANLPQRQVQRDIPDLINGEKRKIWLVKENE